MDKIMMGNERKLLKKETPPPSTTTDDCRSVIDVCQLDTHYDYDTDIDDMTVSMARRMSITRVLARKSVAWARYSLQKLPIRLTFGNLGFLTVTFAVIMPRAFTYMIIYPIFRLVFGLLYPAYASYKAVRTKNVKEYVKWMMYWIVFALFMSVETFTDVFFSFWFPFYYEIKIILVLWLLSPATKGSSILYRRFVHPALIRREAEIDDALARATEQGYTAVLHLGTKGVNYATTVLMQTAIKNLPNALLNPQSNSVPESQSDPAISSLVIRKSPIKNEKTDSVDSPSGRHREQSNDSRESNDIQPLIDPSSDTEEDEFGLKNEDEYGGSTLNEYKAVEKPKKTRRVPRRRAAKSHRAGTLRNYEAAYSDGTDAESNLN